MSLVKVIGNGQITLPPEAREALRVKDGDYLEAEVVEGEVRLKPAAIADREAAWRRIREAQASVRYTGPEPRPDPEEEERRIFEAVEEFRDRRD
jgi:AbrB family looped-hinge helix DNA binding protein